MLPLSTFKCKDSSFLIYPEPPWKETSEIPDEWFKTNVNKFLYPQETIISEAVPYTVDDGPHASGIYFLLKGNDIFYVGKSASIRRRMIQHWDKCWDIQRYWCFGDIPELYIEQVEAFYIYTIKPALNVKYPILHETIKPLVVLAKENKLKYCNQ